MPTIAHISDLHFGRIDLRVAEALVEDLHGFRPTLLVASGDFTQRARRRQYRNAAAYLDRLPQPQLRVPGNHDIPLFDLFRRFFAPLGRYRHYITPDLAPVISAGPIWVAGLSSARAFTLTWDGFWKDGWLSPDQFHTLRRIADAPREGQFRVLVTHHPFLPPPGLRAHGIIHRPERALAHLEAIGIDLLLAGHLHRAYSGDVRIHHEAMQRSVLSVQAGTATSTRRRGEPNAYNRILIDPATPEVTVQVRRWSGDRFEDGDRTRYRRPGIAWEQVPSG